jgi:hypothetical protein
VLFTDIVMPGLAGRQLAGLGATLRPDLVIVFTAGYARGSLNRESSDRDIVLHKPFTLNQAGAKDAPSLWQAAGEVMAFSAALDCHIRGPLHDGWSG